MQDIVIEITYEVFPKAVFHGGTAVWRCYDGTRFSEDIDIYLRKKDIDHVEIFKEKLNKKKLDVKKFKVTDNVIYSKISLGNTIMRFEASFLNYAKDKIVIRKYQTIDGNYMPIFTLTAEELIKEKVKAYLSRRFIRDLYDIYILLEDVEHKKEIVDILRKFILKYKEPIDKDILSSLVFFGAVPSVKQMMMEIKRWAR